MFDMGIAMGALAAPSAGKLPVDKAISIADIGRFLMPQSDPVQISFFWLILLSVTGALIWVGRTASPDHWQQRWKESKADYNSPQDLSDAVAMPAERFCDALPSILLIVGLLGTFIGLGVALNDAARVFDLPNNEQFGQLSAVIHSLGTKFKVSTWGIIGYLLVRSVAAWAGWNGKRLMWCIGQMRSDADALRRKREGLQSAVEGRVRSEISTASREISAGTDRLGKVLDPLLDAIKQNTHATQASLKKFVDSHVESMDRIAGSAKDMGHASKGMSSAADQVGVTAANLQAVVELLQDKLVTAIELMNDSFNKNLAEMSSKIEKSTVDISSTMGDLGKTVGATMGRVESVIKVVSVSFEETAKTQAKTIDDFNIASETLSQNAEKMHKPIQELNTRLTSQLATMAGIGTDVVAFGKSNIEMAKVNDEVRTFLRGLSDRTELGEICKTSDVRRLEGEIAKGNGLLAELVILTRNDTAMSGNSDLANGNAA